MSDDDSLASGCDYDHSPLRDALAAGKFEEADQIHRDSLIDLAGLAAQNRGYVYFSEAHTIPIEDMKTLDSLWSKYSDGKFGFAVQKRLWNRSGKKWTEFFRSIDWVRGEDDSYVRWNALGSGDSDFVYSTEAKPGHLPLTNTLRGTQLLEKILSHPAFD
jgi:hypothetical protein